MEQLYMYITSSPEHFHIEDYTRYITTIKGFGDMLVNILEEEDDYLGILEEDINYSLGEPNKDGYIIITITGLDCLGDHDTIERGLIPVNFYN